MKRLRKNGKAEREAIAQATTIEHTSDEECTVVDGSCVVCNVDHTGECLICDGRGFHKPGCEMGEALSS